MGGLFHLNWLCNFPWPASYSLRPNICSVGSCHMKLPNFWAHFQANLILVNVSLSNSHKGFAVDVQSQHWNLLQYVMMWGYHNNVHLLLYDSSLLVDSSSNWWPNVPTVFVLIQLFPPCYHLCTYLVWVILSNYFLNLCLLTLPVREILQMVFICEIIVALLVDENDCHYNIWT